MSGLPAAIGEKTEDELQRLKTEFLSSLNHEIRTPLASILGMTDLLLETPLDGEQREYLEATRVCAEELLATLSNALEYAALAAGNLPLEQAEFNLREALERAVERELAKAQAKGLKLTAALAGSLPLVAVGDAVRLEEALRHLLRNAIEFTAQGEVDLRAGGRLAGDDRFLLRVEVCDTGPGMSPEQLELVFQPFRQLEGGLARNHPGLGLGLALVERLVRLMQGELVIHSTPGQGSRLGFQIPLRVRRAD